VWIRWFHTTGLKPAFKDFQLLGRKVGTVAQLLNLLAQFIEACVTDEAFARWITINGEG